MMHSKNASAKTVLNNEEFVEPVIRASNFIELYNMREELLFGAREAMVIMIGMESDQMGQFSR